MRLQYQIEQTLLWIFVILSALVIGGGLYEMCVMVPLWASSPPDSAWYWETQRLSFPQYAPNAGIRFWIYLTPLHFIVSIATLIVGWKTAGWHRTWLAISTIIFIVMHLSAFLWFAPVATQIMNSRSRGISPERVVARTHLWVRLSWARFVIEFVGFLCGLRALQVR